MKDTWVLVADAAVARLFNSSPDFGDLSLEREFSHPHGRSRDQDLISDKAGRAFKGEARRTTMDTPSSPHEKEMSHFARELAEALDQELGSRPEAKLVLVCAPHFLGLVRKHLSPAIAAKVVQSLDRDYTLMHSHELAGALRGALRGVD